MREALLQRQRAFREMPGLIADGRDMGTVVFPDAPLKVFRPPVPRNGRAAACRLKGKGEDVSLSSLLDEIRARDERDLSDRPAETSGRRHSAGFHRVVHIEQVLQRIRERIAQRDLL